MLKELYWMLKTFLKFLWKAEENLFRGIVRAVRGKYSVRIEDVNILHDSANFLLVEKHHDVIINGGAPNQCKDQSSMNTSDFSSISIYSTVSFPLVILFSNAPETARTLIPRSCQPKT